MKFLGNSDNSHCLFLFFPLFWGRYSHTQLYSKVQRDGSGVYLNPCTISSALDNVVHYVFIVLFYITASDLLKCKQLCQYLIHDNTL